ncbi:type II toxin-antitoxin system RelE/ParE family toxin [Autumnicola psychrophila]|uniref:Type II toxin-antitoxin system RelE/ParE family toxin n=1 Tax=Autumnicola psychrophila TaxID=3075592 RepID=A0ABU3DQU5_9FLAO|nr:type II toxin-antitoxin system RelE/ParE family toxin [Zunongwangia sp. F225]MDT0686086.1 type II toxin-antitoxin system RelE/ParE family toxin [Zunongwangia sp. F225]
MKIKLSGKFRFNLEKQIRYIAKDKPLAARKFKNDLFLEIRKISSNPYSFRKSIYFDNEEVRDLTFKGYCITFRINSALQLIEVFGFTKYTLFK